MSTWAVDSSTLQFYLNWFAQPGDTLQLAPGTYSGISLTNFAAGGVTITSADPSHPAVMTDLTLTGASGLTFSNLDFAAGNATGYSYVLKNSSDLHFDHVSVHGSLDGDAGNDGNGFSVSGSSNISITNSEFQQLGRAAVIGTTSNIQLTGNNVHDLRSDAFDFAQVDHVVISGNTISNFHPVSGDHPDALQFWTAGTTAATHDVTISDNVILRGSGDAIQGVFMSDTSNLPYDNVLITDNFIDGTGFNAIRISGAVNLTLSGNELVSNPGRSNVTYILIQNSDHVTSLNNDAVAISFDHVTNLTRSGDTLNTAVTDLGASAMQAFSLMHPETASLLAAYVPAGPSIAVPVSINIPFFPDPMAVSQSVSSMFHIDIQL